jgi:hypothetical protein
LRLLWFWRYLLVFRLSAIDNWKRNALRCAALTYLRFHSFLRLFVRKAKPIIWGLNFTTTTDRLRTSDTNWTGIKVWSLFWWVDAYLSTFWLIAFFTL